MQTKNSAESINQLNQSSDKRVSHLDAFVYELHRKFR